MLGKQIRSFAHKGLELFFRTGSTRGIQAAHTRRLELVLYLLDAVATPEDMHFPGSRLHRLESFGHGFVTEAGSIEVFTDARICTQKQPSRF